MTGAAAAAAAAKDKQSFRARDPPIFI